MNPELVFKLFLLLPMYPLILPWGKLFTWGAIIGWFGLWGGMFYVLEINSTHYSSNVIGLELLIAASIMVLSVSVVVRCLIHKIYMKVING
ncbi:MAG: hypothetical protein B0W54_23590 [Cellvibrio sp. 79]|nr:MAG: hypothetical protein B0W54_23590 [Cellvibrio sp. 79]